MVHWLLHKKIRCMFVFEDIIERMKNNSNDSIVLIDSIERRGYTRSDFFSDVSSVVDYLIRLSCDQVIIRENNSYDLLLLYFGAMFSNKTIIPIDPEKDDCEVIKIRKMHEDSVFINIGEIRNLIAPFVARSGVLPWDSINKDKVYLITYTSGSTGEPKGVKHTLNDLFFSAYEFGNVMKYGCDTVMGHCMPMTYMAGILNTVIMPFIMNGKIVLLKRFSIKNSFDFWRNIKENNINTLWLSPTMLRIINLLDKKADMYGYFHDVNMKISIGTAPLDRQLRYEFESKYNIRLYQSYGLSETLFVSTEVPEEKESEHSVGRLLPSVRLSYTKDDEIEICVPWMFQGYTNIETAPYMDGEKYLSGDLGKMRGDNLIITGRKKELIIKGGYNINPLDIENFILEKGLASECAVVPVKVRGEELIGVYIVSDNEYTVAEINASIVDYLGEHHKIDFLERVAFLPKNLNGKIDKMNISKKMEDKYGVKI